MSATTQPQTYEFYYQFFHISREFRIPVQKSLEDVPEAYRAELVRKMECRPKGKAMRWPFNPSEAEIQKMEAELTCPHCNQVGVMKFIWPVVAE